MIKIIKEQPGHRGDLVSTFFAKYARDYPLDLEVRQFPSWLLPSPTLWHAAMLANLMTFEDRDGSLLQLLAED
jgi:hypothetical protein